MSEERKKLIKKIIIYAFLVLILIAIYFPMIMLIIFSFTPAKSHGKWEGFNPLYYALIFRDKEIMSAISNSLIIALISATLAMTIGTISAIGVYNLGKKSKSAANSINQVTVINSEIVTAAAFMLFFMLFRKFAENSLDAINAKGAFADFILSIIKNDYVKLVIAHTMVTIPFVILSVTPRLTQLNPNLYEAGLDLGATPRGALFKVLIPQLIPSMISGFIMAFTLSLDDFLLTNFIKDEVETISTIIYNGYKKSGAGAVYRVLSSLILYVVLAVLVIFNLINKRKTAAKLNSSTAKIINQKEKLK